MKIAITGGTGFVGTAVTKALVSRGEEITLLSRNEGTGRNGASIVKVDYHSPQSLYSALNGCDAVIHLAAALFCRSSQAYFKANTDSARNLRIAAEKAGIKKIVYVSSLAAGGAMPPEGPDRNEEMPDNPISNYGKSKLAAENELSSFSGSLSILRPPIVYGPKDAGFSKIAEWVRKGLMVVPGSAETRFSFIYLYDLAACIEKALYAGLPSGKKYYVCENSTFQWGEFIEHMAMEMKVKRPKMISLPPAALYAAGFIYEIISYLASAEPVLNRDKAREAAAGKWTCSPAKWEKETGHKNWTSLKEGLKMTFSEGK